MKKIKWISILLSIGIVLGSCAGDDGEPGPVGDAGTAGNNGATGVAGALGQGLEKVGYFQGTVSGKRTDGTAFSEVFKFEYGRTNADAFRDDSGSKWLDLFRYNKVYYYNSGIEVYGLKLSGTSLVTDPTQTQVYFDFAKELSMTDLFRLSATPYFKDSKGYIISLSSEQNKLYNFNASNMNIGYTETQYETANGIIPVYLFYVYGQTASYLVYYRKDDGTVLIIKDQSNGNPITSGAVFDKYNKLLFKNNTTVNALTFFDKATGTSLHTVIPDIAADQLTITNYNHDATSGVLTFDYTLKISGYRGIVHGANTSGNDLIITGSFNSGGKIYKNNSGRTGD